MEKAQPDVTAPENLDQCDLRLIKVPSRREVAAVLVAVGVAQHYLLSAAASLQVALVFGKPEQLIHYQAAVPEIGNRLKQGNDVDIQLAFTRPQQAGFLEEQRYF